MSAPKYTSASLINPNRTETYYNKETSPEAPERYERRILSLAIQLLKTLRRVFRNEWADYATLAIRPSLNAFGHGAATEMYDALLSENRNGTTKIQATSNNDEGVYIRTGPYFQAKKAPQEAPEVTQSPQANLVRAEQPHQPNKPYRSRKE